MKPQWFVLSLSGNHTPVHVLERTIKQIVEGLLLKVRNTPGRIHRCGLPRSYAHWARDGRTPTECVTWVNSQGSSENLMERLNASAFFGKAPEI
jgi:hypothetical protein